MGDLKNRPVTVYRWDDAGAPSIGTTKASDVINILKKCLVEGYGTKQPLGWSIPFENISTNKVVFRNSTTDGSGGFVQFWDYDGTNVNSSRIAYKGAVGMVGLDSFDRDQVRMLLKISTTHLYWVLIGTSRGFWFMTNNSLTTPNGSSNEKACFFVGDFESFVTNDVGSFVNIQYPTNVDMTNSSWNYSFDASVVANSSVARVYDTDSSNNSVFYKLDNRYLAGATNLNGVPTVDRIFYKPLIYSPTTTTSNDRLGVNASISAINPFYRGTIAGLLNTPQGGYLNQPWPVIETINGVQHFLMPGYQFGRNWINMGTWYE
ncbi:hypothetical protein [Shewanella subflava]|uniref:Virion structural protein n=1 Tax=Shewanella subflava TaxID=2986476 RepID=A0ABT3I5V0_9GAMM|nr:hypothetical protein [Shewanella subflava]MCW3171436.1 hypothetical protein [Shewanella subflava]